ncbi:MAG: GNAT family N-acetyltransferase [Acidimicrobiia bacterium]|nr:GNAT family N-acetyltransferase [Acidimicrobiia bacterium]
MWRGNERLMALADQPATVSQRGQWPGRVTLRRGWARAEARPWNDDEPKAALRLLRGGPSFLEACASRLLDLGVTGVMSPPLPLNSQRSWTQAGFAPFIDLALMRKSLENTTGAPDHLVVERPDTDIEDLLNIDAAAFPPFWRFNRGALEEAIGATSRSTTLTILGSGGTPIAYAVVGFGSAIAYLQRVAVEPEWQGHGMGRSLVRVVARKARSSGAKVLLLNTQMDNHSAIGLYEDEGFIQLPEPLTLLQYPPEETKPRPG